MWVNRTIAVGRHGHVVQEAPSLELWGVVTFLVVQKLLNPVTNAIGGQTKLLIMLFRMTIA